MLFITIINFLDNKVGAAFSVITTIEKMIPIAAIIIFGIFWGQNNALGQTIADVKQSSGGFGVAVLATLFAYDGWILIANLGGEMKNPQKVLFNSKRKISYCCYYFYHCISNFNASIVRS